MKKYFLLASLALTTSAHARIDVIYGEDNRLDVYETRNSLHRELAKSTLGMINKSKFVKTSYGYDLTNVNTLERSHNICSSEKYSQQYTAPNCSAFLVGDDVIVTAGHCLRAGSNPEASCKDNLWVFDYDMKSSYHNPTKNISAENVYECKQVLAQEYSSMGGDYAIIKLDRKVTGRKPLKFRSSGKVSSYNELLVIGHPTGLPTKIAAGGRVTKNSQSDRFSTTLDTFHGNSGSAVFDARTGMVEGILIQGKADYQPSSFGNPASCKVVNVCDNSANNCSAGNQQGAIAAGEVVLRITEISSALNSFID